MVRRTGSSGAIARDRVNLAKAFRTSGLIVKQAFDVYIEDSAGKKYLDLTAGGTTAIGYSHPRLTQALLEQVANGIDHIDRATGIMEIETELAKAVKSFLTPPLSRGRIVFGHSGSDIVEKAIRLVRFAKTRPIVVSYYEAHHGANATALSASPTLREMGSNTIARFFQLPGFMHIPFPDSYRPWFSDSSDAGQACLAFFERLLSSVVSPEMVAGVIMEPILSLGGNTVPPDGYFQGLAKICSKNGIPLIADEVMTGIGKTGRMFAIEHWNLSPDVLCIGKALSGPLPLTLLLAEETLADQWQPRDYVGISKDGYSLGCATAIQTLKIIREERLVENAERVGQYLARRLLDMKRDLHLKGEVRGLGLMMAIDLVTSEETKKPASAYAQTVVSHARREGLIVGLTGTARNVIRFVPSLTVNQSHIDAAIDILSEALKNS